MVLCQVAVLVGGIAGPVAALILLFCRMENVRSNCLPVRRLHEPFQDRDADLCAV